jgi:hypothetical protein
LKPPLIALFNFFSASFLWRFKIATKAAVKIFIYFGCCSAAKMLWYTLKLSQLSGRGSLFCGVCLVSYTYKLGTCDALRAEMWGMHISMNLAMRQGITHL